MVIIQSSFKTMSVSLPTYFSLKTCSEGLNRVPGDTSPSSVEISAHFSVISVNFAGLSYQLQARHVISPLTVQILTKLPAIS